MNDEVNGEKERRFYTSILQHFRQIAVGLVGLYYHSKGKGSDGN
jgi:hypothetical protein